MIEQTSFRTFPKPVGAWVVGRMESGEHKYAGLRIHMFRKPRFLTRFPMKHLVEWEWEDA